MTVPRFPDSNEIEVDTGDSNLWGRRLVRAIGWVSLAMGLTLAAPGPSARLFGLGTRPRLMCAIGVRDLVIGLGLLRHRRPATWLRLHALADLVDAAIVGGGLLAGRVARWRGALWVAVALGSGWVSLAKARRLDQTDHPG